MFLNGGIFSFSKTRKSTLHTTEQRHIDIQAKCRYVFAVFVLDANGGTFHRTAIGKLITVVRNDAGKVS